MTLKRSLDRDLRENLRKILVELTEKWRLELRERLRVENPLAGVPSLLRHQDEDEGDE
ncbi:hypothetical protein JW905_00310 [bacterium]|nr:hypothetical protein [candidate division CSSED10-310 bacterium]